jgi:hypothetical protein
MATYAYGAVGVLSSRSRELLRRSALILALRSCHANSAPQEEKNKEKIAPALFSLRGNFRFNLRMGSTAAFLFLNPLKSDQRPLLVHGLPISLSSQLLDAAEHLSTGLVQSPGSSPSSTGSGSDGDSD